MNFVSKFDATLPADHLGAHFNAHAHVETVAPHTTHIPPGAIVVPDTQLLFNGEYKRSGVDLILSRDHHELVLQDYFKGEKHAALASPEGAYLTGDIVNALTGHVEYAQAGGAVAAATVIGHVTKITGSATAIRNGVSVILNNGDNVEKGDVVQAGSDSTLGITFIDGTVFGLSSNARMVLNEMVYDPNGSSNSSLISLVAGTISFVAGETAKHGDMKIDTPVATMGIRGTAVLVEIDFSDPGDVKMQVLVEPDGRTGRYTVFDKYTLTKIAEVNKAGQSLNFHRGAFSESSEQLTPEEQKLITDVFAQKFTDNTNPQQLQHFTDSINPLLQLTAFVLPSGQSATPVVQLISQPGSLHQNIILPPTSGTLHIPGPPTVAILDNHGSLASSFAMTELPGKTGDSADFDRAVATVNFVDINAGDTPSVSATFNSFTYHDAHGNDLGGTLNALQQADIAALEIKLGIAPGSGNNNNGTATLTYSVVDSAFDFLAAGETLTLTYFVRVDNNYAGNDEATTLPITITITGTNDVPVITTGAESVAYSGGKLTPGGNLQTIGGAPTKGTLAFTDVDLTDTHKVAAKLTGASMSGPGAPTLDQAALEALAPNPMKLFASALSANVATDSTGTGSGTISWSLADLPVYLADFIPKGETLTLTYTVTVTDSQNATSTQNVIVTIAGTAAAAVVWIETTDTVATDIANGILPGDWNAASHWETGTVPKATDDAIIITDQLQTLTPYYPVTIGAAAVAQSLTMNDFSDLTDPNHPQPRLFNHSTLTIGPGGISLSADSRIDNYGTIGVGAAANPGGTVTGKMEVLDQSVLHNYGTINLADGGDFKDASTISNTGGATIEVSGGTLNITVNVDNTGGNLTVDGPATLMLKGATINNAATGGGIFINALTEGASVTKNGTVTNSGTLNLNGDGVLRNGSLVNAGQINVNGSGNALDGVDVTANHALEIFSSGALLLDLGTQIANTYGTTNKLGGTITVDSDATLTLDGATINNAAAGGGIFINALTEGAGVAKNGTITNNGTLNLNGDGVLKNGLLDNSGQINVNGSGNALDGVNVTANHALEILSGGTLLLDQGTHIANGATTVDRGGTLTLDGVTINDGATIDGGTVTNKGTLFLDGNAVLKNGTLGNSGQINVGAGGNALDAETITNLGTIKVDGGALTIDSAVTFTNSGTLEAVNGGTLNLISTTVSDPATGVTTAGAGSHINLQDATLLQHTVSTEFGGEIDTVGGTSNTINTANGALDLSGRVNNAGTLGIADNSSLTLISAAYINNTGTIELNSTGDNTDLYIDQRFAGFDGGGNVTLSDDTHNIIAAMTSGDQLTNNSNTISGAGEIGRGGLVLVNNAVIDANGQNALKLDPLSLTNTGTLEATNGATLLISNTTVTNHFNLVNGTIAAVGTNLPGTSHSSVGLQDATILGGNISITAQAAIVATSGVNTINGAASITNSAGTLEANGAELDLVNSTVNNTSGLVNDVNITGIVYVTGTNGTIKLEDATISGGAVYTTGASDIVEAAGGTNLFDDVATISNAGTVAANGGMLTVDDASAFTNTGLVEAISDSLLVLNHVALSNTDGVAGDPVGGVTVGLGSTLDLTTATITAGTVTNSGEFDLSDNAVLQNGTLVNSGQIKVGGSGNALHNENVTANHALEILSGGALLIDQGTQFTNTYGTESGGTITIDGTGTLTLDGAAINDGATIDGGTITVKSNGTFDLNGNAVLQNGSLGNSGQINVGAGGNALHDEHVTANNALEVLGGGALVLDLGTQFTNTGGLITIDNGAALTLDGATVNNAVTDGGTITNGGTLNLNGTGVLQYGLLGNSGQINVNGSGNALDGVNVTANHALEIFSDSTLLLDQGTYITNSGQTTVDSAATLTLDGATDGATIDGGTVTNKGTLYLNGNGVLKNGSLVNSNQINVGASGNALHNEDVTANHALEVLAGGALLLDLGTKIANAEGTITVDGTGTLQLNDATISGGTINDYSLGTDGTTVLAGAIDVTGTSTINGNASLNNGGVTVEAHQTLTLDNVTATATVFTDTAAGAALSVGSENALTLQGGADVHGGSLFNAGTVQIETTGATFDGVDVVNTGVGVVQVDESGGTPPPSPVTLTFLETSTVTDGTLSIGNNGQVEVASAATATWDSVTVDNGSGLTPAGHIQVDGTLDLSGTTTISGGTLGISGTLQSTGTNAIDGTAITVSNAATFDVTAGTMTIDAASSVNTTGTFEANGGNLIVDGTLTGTATIVGASLLELGAENSAANVTFAAKATGTLQLDHAKSFGGTVSGLDDNTLDLRDISDLSNPTVSYSGTASGGTLSILVGGVDVSDIKLSGDYLGVHWSLANDGSSQQGTDISEIPGAITAGLDANGNASEGGAVAAIITDGGQQVTGATYDWQVFDTAHDKWIDGSGTGVTSANYTPGETDEGHALRVSLTFTDANGHSDTSTVSDGTVNPVADQPVVTVSAAPINEDGTSTLTLTLTNATDLFEGSDDSVTLTVTLDHGTTLHGTGVTDNGNGSFTLTAASVADLSGLTITPSSEFEGTIAIGISAVTHDGTAVSVAGTTSTTLMVSPVADQPVVTVSAAPINEDGTSTLTLALTNAAGLFEGSDDSVTLTVTLDHGATLHGTGVVDNGGGTFTLTANSATDLNGLTITPASEFEGTIAIGVSAITHDGVAVSAAGITSTTLTVSPVADPPVVTASATTINEDGTSALTLTLTNAAGLFENGDDSVTVTVSLSDGAKLHGTGVVDNGDGTFTLTANSATDLNGLTITPALEFEGTVAIGVSAIAHDGSSDSAIGQTTASLTVNPVADAPALAALHVNNISDSLTASTIDTTKWTVFLPTIIQTGSNDSSVTPTSNGVVLHDHGYLDTVAGFTPTAATPLHIGLSFTLDSGGGYVAVTDGTDGTIAPQFGAPANGLSFMFDWANGVDIVNNANGQSVDLNASFSLNTRYDVSITDNGSSQSFVVTNDATGQQVASGTTNFTNTAVGDLVTITNREDNDSMHTATVSDVTISNAYHGLENGSVTFAGLTALTDADGTDTLALDLSGFPAGATFSVGALDSQNGHWVISAAQIASLGATPLTMTPPADYNGNFTLHVDATVTDPAPGLATDTKTFSNDLAVTVDAVDDASFSLTGLNPAGNAVEGQQITAVVTDTDAPASGITYTFQAFDGTHWNNMQSSSSASYTPPEAVEGERLRVNVSYTDTHGNAESGSVSAGTVQESATNDLIVTLNTTSAAEGKQITVTGVTDGGIAVTAGLTYAWQVSTDGTHWTTVSSNNFYAPGEADEGKSLHLVTTYADQPGGNSEQTTTSFGTVGDITPVLVAPYSFAVDEFKIVKGSAVFDDTFAQPPPAGTNFGSTPLVNFTTQGSTWTESGGKAILSSQGSIALTATETDVIARLLTNTEDQSVNSGGLKENTTFKVSATFDLVAPTFAGAEYGIDLNDSSATHANDEMVQLVVTGDGLGDATVKLVQANFSTNTYTTIASQTLTASQLSGNTQIELDLNHGTAGSSAITGSFELLNNGTQTSTQTFATTGHVFNNVTYTRADIFSAAPQGVVVTGTAQQGQTLTAHTSTNESDASIHYQWQSSSDGTTNWSNIGTDSAQYVLGEADEGRHIHVVATTSDTDNTSTASVTSTATAAVANVAPVAHDDAISNASPPSGNGWVLDTENGHYYREVTTHVTFAQAVAGAAADGGYLATITSADEQAFVVNHVIGGLDATWLGGETNNDQTGNPTANAGTFFWVTGPEAGTGFAYSNWNSGEPNGGFSATTQYLQIGPTGGWNDSTDKGQPGDGAGAGYLEEWGGLPNQIAFNENTGTTLTAAQLLANVTDIDNSVLTITSVGDQNGHSLHGGTVSLNGNIISYTPAANYSGTDSFAYTVSDDGVTSTANVTFNVVAPNDAPVVTISTSAKIDFDGFDASAGIDGATLSNYFAGYGITLSSSHGADPMIVDDRVVYGGGIFNATSGHNVIGENGGHPVSYTVAFTHPLTSFEFDRVQENAGPSGSSYPLWTATAYDASGNVLSTVSESEHIVLGSSSVPAAHYVLSGGDIDHVTFTGDDQGHDGFANVLTDSWVLNGTTALATNEDTPLAINGISVSDGDAGSAQIEVTLAVAHGTVTLENAAGLDSVTGNVSGSVNLFGSQTAIDAALASGIVYTPTSGYSGSDTLGVTANDQGHTGSGGAQTTTQHIALTVSGGPVIDTGQFSIASNEDGTTTISGLQISDSNPSGTFKVTATTAGPGSSVTPATDDDPLDQTNADLATGLIYHPGQTPPATDKVTVTVADHFGATDTVNFIFNLANPPQTTPVVLTGTSGNDVIFGTGYGDVLTGGGGHDQFVFKPNSGPNVAQHTITDFVDGLDKIDIRQFNAITASSLSGLESQQGNDTQITLDSHDTLILKNVQVANLHNSDFIFHV